MEDNTDAGTHHSIATCLCSRRSVELIYRCNYADDIEPHHYLYVQTITWVFMKVILRLC